MILGIDVSEYQGRPDWQKVRESGVQFAFARASQGTYHVDLSYSYNRAGIPNAGIIPGAYHFLVPGSGAAQADYFLTLADPDAIHALDVERSGVDVAGFVARYRALFPAHPLIVYSGRDLWRQAVPTPPAQPWGPLWLAGPTPNVYVPGGGALVDLWQRVGNANGALPWGGWNAWTFMQFTDNATIPGISGPVDGDVFNGSLDELQALRGIPMAVDLTQSAIDAIVNRLTGAAPPAQGGAEYRVHDPADPSHLLVLTDALTELLAQGQQNAATLAKILACVSGNAPAK